MERRGLDHSRASAALRLAGPPPGLTPLRLGEVRVRVRVRVRARVRARVRVRVGGCG